MLPWRQSVIQTQGEITPSDNVAKYKKKKDNLLLGLTTMAFTRIWANTFYLQTLRCVCGGASLGAVDLRCGLDKVKSPQFPTIYPTQSLHKYRLSSGVVVVFTHWPGMENRGTTPTALLCLQKGQVPLGMHYTALLDSLITFLKAQSWLF